MQRGGPGPGSVVEHVHAELGRGLVLDVVAGVLTVRFVAGVDRRFPPERLTTTLTPRPAGPEHVTMPASWWPLLDSLTRADGQRVVPALPHASPAPVVLTPRRLGLAAPTGTLACVEHSSMWDPKISLAQWSRRLVDPERAATLGSTDPGTLAAIAWCDPAGDLLAACVVTSDASVVRWTQRAPWPETRRMDTQCFVLVDPLTLFEVRSGSAMQRTFATQLRREVRAYPLALVKGGLVAAPPDAVGQALCLCFACDRAWVDVAYGLDAEGRLARVMLFALPRLGDAQTLQLRPGEDLQDSPVGAIRWVDGGFTAGLPSLVHEVGGAGYYPANRDFGAKIACDVTGERVELKYWAPAAVTS